MTSCMLPHYSAELFMPKYLTKKMGRAHTESHHELRLVQGSGNLHAGTFFRDLGCSPNFASPNEVRHSDAAADSIATIGRSHQAETCLPGRDLLLRIIRGSNVGL